MTSMMTGSGWVRGFATVSVIGLAVATPARAQEAMHTFDIPAQPLSKAIAAFARQSRAIVLAPSALTRGKTSVAVKGSMSASEALRILIGNSALSVTERGDGALLVSARQGGPDPKDSFAAADSNEDIVVTGSNIRGGNPESPVITLTRKDIDRSGYSTAGDLIKSLPQSSSGGQNFNVRGSSNQTAGGNYSSISSANLRGLGSDATLTLVNGRRLAYGGLYNAVDISAIPFGAIERVEVLTDGASSVYGSDAVGGVVNFVLFKKFEGGLTTLNSGVSTYGDGSEQQVNQLVGTAWRSGGILVDYEFFKKSAILATDRPFSASAPSPNALSPEQEKHSGFVSFQQNITNNLTFGADGIYTRRNSVNDASTTSGISKITARERQYGVTPQLNWQLGSWSAKLAVDFAEDRQSSDFANIVRSTGRASPSTLSLINQTRNYEAQASGAIFELPAGSVKVAIGGGHRSEELTYTSIVLPSRVTSYGGSRSISYGYGEVRVPLFSPENEIVGINKLELSTSGRFEHYSDFGGSFSPKIGVSYKPIGDLNLRATWGRSFKAPTLSQYVGWSGLTVYSATAYVPGAAAGSVVAIRGGANRDLSPERATSLTVGFDYTPHWAPKLKLNTTYFRITYRDRIATPIGNILTAYSNPVYAPYVLKNPNLAQYQSAVDSAQIFTNIAGAFSPDQVVAIYYAQNQNLYRQGIYGADFSGSYSIDIGSTKIAMFANISFLDIKQQNLSTLPGMVITGTIFNPAKFRARGGIQFQRGMLGGSLIANHVGPEVDNSSNFNTAASAVNVPVGPMTTFDTQIVIGSTNKSDQLKGYQFSISIENILNKEPPQIALTSGASFYTGFGYDTANYSPIGRFFRISASKRW